MKTESATLLRNPADGGLGFRIIHFEDDKHFNELQRVPYFSIILISEGEGPGYYSDWKHNRWRGWQCFFHLFTRRDFHDDFRHRHFLSRWKRHTKKRN